MQAPTSSSGGGWGDSLELACHCLVFVRMELAGCVVLMPIMMLPLLLLLELFVVTESSKVKINLIVFPLTLCDLWLACLAGNRKRLVIGSCCFSLADEQYVGLQLQPSISESKALPP